MANELPIEGGNTPDKYSEFKACNKTIKSGLEAVRNALGGNVSVSTLTGLWQLLGTGWNLYTQILALSPTLVNSVAQEQENDPALDLVQGITDTRTDMIPLSNEIKTLTTDVNGDILAERYGSPGVLDANTLTSIQTATLLGHINTLLLRYQ